MAENKEINVSNVMQGQSNRPSSNASDRELIAFMKERYGLEYAEGEKLEKKLSELRKSLAKQELREKHEAERRWEEENGSYLKNKAKELAKAAGQELAKQYESLLVSYTESQQKLSYGLLGSGITYSQMIDNMQALTSNAYIKQNDVYKKLTDLVSRGITTNASQRAFLAAATEQVGIAFDATDDALNRLINLQKTDFSEARVAQMAGLKTFLQQNYQTSQYIRDGFRSVSAALVEAQSMMAADTATRVEGVVQKWLGALSSSGANSNTINSLATAIGQLGSGDVSGLSGGMGNLIAMGASRAGLSYGNLLTGGLNEQETNALMGGIVSYIASMNTGSNVATNAIAKVFGLNVSDIKAAQNSNAGMLMNNNPNYDIAQFFKEIQDSTNFGSRANNILSNLISGGALNATDSMLGNLAAYRIINTVGNIAGQALSDMGGIWAIPGALLSNSKEVQALASIGLNLGSDVIKNGLGDIGSTIEALFGGETSNMLSDYQRLGALNSLAGVDYTQSGSSRGSRTSGSGVSYSGTRGTSANLRSSANVSTVNYSGVQEAKSIEDVYNQLLLTNDYLSNPLVTVSTLAESGNAVVLGSAENTKYITDMLTITAVSTQNIYALLENYFAGRNNKIIDMSQVGLENMWGDWAGQPARS